MGNGGRTFDFMAEAEDTGKQFGEVAKRLPGAVRADLAAEYRQSPW